MIALNRTSRCVKKVIAVNSHQRQFVNFRFLLGATPSASQWRRLWGGILLLSLMLPGSAGWTQGIPFYQIYVRSEDLERVQTQVPDAILVEGEEGVFILAGSFGERTNAERRLAELEQLGLPVQLVLRQPGDPTPVAVSPSSSTPSPSPTPSPEPVPPQSTPEDPTAQAGDTPALVPGSPTPDPTPPPLQTGSANAAEFDSSRPFWVLVPNPSQDGQVTEQVRRFFPTARDVIYQQQAALQTGSFSQLALAQEQSRWLTNQGLTAVAIPNPDLDTLPLGQPTTGDPGISSAPGLRGEGLWVLVADPVGEQLPTLQQSFPGAIPLRFDGIQVVKTGGFDQAELAQQQVEQLAAMGFEAGVFPADLSRSEPLLTSEIPPSDVDIPEDVDLAGAGGVTTGFLVVVPAQEGRLEQVQSQVPDAFLRRSGEQTVIQVGSYQMRSSAEQAVQALVELGLEGQIIDLAEVNP